MLLELASGERTVGQLAEPFAMSLAAASKHIKVLESAGLIQREVRGRAHLCRLDPGPLESAHEWLSFYERFWTARLDILDRLLREEDEQKSDRPPETRRREMNERAKVDAYGALSEPATLTIQRMLPGPIERVWAYLTESDLRRKWLASGDMEMKVGAPFELVWRNSELTDPPGKRPEGFGEEHRMESRILELDPPRKLVFTWGKEDSDVSMTLEPRGEKVLLDRGPPPPAHPRHDGRRQHRLARASRHAGRPPERRGDGAVLGPVQPPQGRIRPAHPGLTTGSDERKQSTDKDGISRIGACPSTGSR